MHNHKNVGVLLDYVSHVTFNNPSVILCIVLDVMLGKDTLLSGGGGGGLFMDR